MEKYLEVKDDLLAGRTPRLRQQGQLSIEDACGLWLDYCEQMTKSGKRGQSYYSDCRNTAKKILATLGSHWGIAELSRDDFAKLAKAFETKADGKPASPSSIRTHLTRVGVFFNWLEAEGHIERKPAFGVAFRGPSISEVENAKLDKPTRIFTRRQVRALLKASKESPRIHAAILLGMNTGCQNIDIQTLEYRHIDWKGGWYNQPRRKRAKPRRAKLWKRTVRALKRQMEGRQLTPESLVFVSNTGGKYQSRDCLSTEFASLKLSTGLDFPKGSGFQWLRHTFATVANQTGDSQAVKISTGHIERDILQNYVHAVFDPRQIAISQHVENWLVRAKK